MYQNYLNHSRFRPQIFWGGITNLAERITYDLKL